jgi:hypothetical protein
MSSRRRVFRIEVATCQACGGRLQPPRGGVTEASAIRAILLHVQSRLLAVVAIASVTCVHREDW